MAVNMQPKEKRREVRASPICISILSYSPILSSSPSPLSKEAHYLTVAYTLERRFAAAHPHPQPQLHLPTVQFLSAYIILQYTHTHTAMLIMINGSSFSDNYTSLWSLYLSAFSLTKRKLCIPDSKHWNSTHEMLQLTSFNDLLSSSISCSLKRKSYTRFLCP